MATLLELSLGWLGDLVAQHLYDDDVPLPQRRRWSIDGDGITVTDDADDEIARFRLTLGADDTYARPTAPSTLVSYDGAEVAWSTNIVVHDDGATANVDINNTVTIIPGNAAGGIALKGYDDSTAIYCTHAAVTIGKPLDADLLFAKGADAALYHETNDTASAAGRTLEDHGQDCTGATSVGGTRESRAGDGTQWGGVYLLGWGSGGTEGDTFVYVGRNAALAAPDTDGRGFLALEDGTPPNINELNGYGCTGITSTGGELIADFDSGERAIIRATTPNVEALSANKALTAADPYYQLLDPGGIGYLCTLPAVGNGRSFHILNTGATSLTVRNPDTSTLVTLASGEFAIVVSSASAWYVVGY